MLEDLDKLQEKAGVLVSWVSEMKSLIQNPYSNGLNMPKVLEDLGGYAADLVKSIYALQEKAKQTEAESEKAESASVEQ